MMKALPDLYKSEVDTFPKDSWSDILDLFGDANIYQTWSYGKVRWGERNTSHFILRKQGQIIGGAQVCLRTVPFLKAGGAYVYWGPLWQLKNAGNSLEDLSAIVRFLKYEYAEKRGLYLRIVPRVIQDENTDFVRILSEHGFHIDVDTPRYRTFIVDITPPLENIRKSLDQKWRNQLNRAEKNDLNVQDGKSDDLYAHFLKLQREMLDRKQFLPGVDYDEFREIQRDLPDKDKMNIVICEQDNEPVTSTVYSAHGDTGIYLLGATGDKGLKAKGAYLSQWLVIRSLKEKGLKSYDLGGINPDTNPGVYHFKSGLRGRDVQFVGAFDVCDNMLSLMMYRLFTYMSRIRK